MNTIACGRIHTMVEPVDHNLLEAARTAATANLADVMHGLGVVEGLSPVGRQFGRIVGRAITADVSPGDGSYSRLALDLCEPGDVLVINAHGCTERAVLGGSVCVAAKARGLAGIVVDGAVRDIAEIESVGLDVLARAVCPRSGSTESGWGEVNVPVALGGSVVIPGDVVVADIEGCVVIPRRDVASVLREVRRVEDEEGRPEDIHARIKLSGVSIPGFDQANAVLERRGVRRIDATFVA